jgi:TonB family protein
VRALAVAMALVAVAHADPPDAGVKHGSLDKEVIRGVIRKHLNEVKFCYEKVLAEKPDLTGRVMIQFTISADGSVVASVVQSSTMNNAVVEDCIVKAVRRWQFPAPTGGGIVIVSYPFVLKADQSDARLPSLAAAKYAGDWESPPMHLTLFPDGRFLMTDGKGAKRDGHWHDEGNELVLSDVDANEMRFAARPDVLFTSQGNATFRRVR